MTTLKWIKCGNGGHWCDLESLKLEKITTNGVYVIWHEGDPSSVVRIGHGDVAERLSQHRNDPAIVVYAKLGTLRVTWAAVSAARQDGVERYLANEYPPLIGDAFPDAEPIAVNSPW
ncbi:MAG: hypothetical protein CMM60_05670 [Rhodospirillaceae bacterium]|jgi:hypothetical protein|nr:hypothetical protein [Rhodospirillaceae bacterium]|tara:strand:+ start:512 stop:862 length:351 start_codon:yes stop_codon:yes gene_type:complete